MASQPNNHTDDGALDRVQQLTWALLDEQISDDEFAQLNSTLLRDDKSRESYLNCVQLHADLMAHFAAPSERSGKRAGTQILGLDMPGLGFQSPSVEEAGS
jgi:hypothetical protein